MTSRLLPTDVRRRKRSGSHQKENAHASANRADTKPDACTVCVCAYLRKHAARELDGNDALERQVVKCLYQFAVGTLDVRPRDGCTEYYTRLNGKQRMQFTRVTNEPPAESHCRVLRVHVPAHLVHDAVAGLHVSLIYTSDKGNKLYKKLRGGSIGS